MIQRMLPVRRTLTLMALMMLASSVMAQTPLRDTGRRMAGEMGEAIITVRIVTSLKMAFGGQQGEEREIKSEINGTVVDPDGTTIVPLSSIDPAQTFKRMMGEGESSEMTMDSRLKDLKLVINKKTEIPATVVLRDADLDLAVLRPTEKQEKPFKAIDLTNAAEPRILDECFVLARMGRVADNEIGVMTGEVQALVSKPRKFYVPSGELASGGMGVPTFLENGKFIGVVLMRMVAGGAESGFGMGDGNTLGIILPAADVADIVKQAKEAK